jgi:hypothetical protein
VARIKKFERITKDRVPTHSDVECGYAVVTYEGAPALLLETYGSSDRKIVGKTSQSILLDRESATELAELIRRSFG